MHYCHNNHKHTKLRRPPLWPLLLLLILLIYNHIYKAEMEWNLDHYLCIHLNNLRSFFKIIFEQFYDTKFTRIIDSFFSLSSECIYQLFMFQHDSTLIYLTSHHLSIIRSVFEANKTARSFNLERFTNEQISSKLMFKNIKYHKMTENNEYYRLNNE